MFYFTKDANYETPVIINTQAGGSSYFTITSRKQQFDNYSTCTNSWSF